MPFAVEPVIVFGNIVADKDFLHAVKSVGKHVVLEFAAVYPENAALIGGCEIAGETVGLVEENDIAVIAAAVGELLHAAEMKVGNRETGFFKNFSDSALYEGFAGLHMAAGE